MGLHAAKCMAGACDELGSGLAFEIFAHSTRFFGKKVVVLGQYNAQNLGLEEDDEGQHGDAAAVAAEALCSFGLRTSCVIPSGSLSPNSAMTEGGT